MPAPHGFSLFVPRTVRGASAFCCFLDAGPPVVQTGVFGDGPTTGEALTSIDDDDDADVVTCSGSAIGRGQTAFQMRRRCFRNVCVGHRARARTHLQRQAPLVPPRAQRLRRRWSSKTGDGHGSPAGRPPGAGRRWQVGVSDERPGPVQARSKGQYRDRSKARLSAQQYPWGGERARARAGKRRSSTAGARARALKTRPSPRIQAPATPPPPASLRSSNRMRAFFGFWLSKAPSITSSPTPFSRTWSDAHMYSQPGQARASTDCRARRRASAERTGLPQPWRSA